MDVKSHFDRGGRNEFPVTMWTQPYTTAQKAGIIFYGILVGLLMVPLAMLGGLILGIFLGAVQTLFGNHGEGAWAVIGGVMFGFYIGIPLGVYVCWRTCRSRLRQPRAEG
jgi:uncharacterized protein YneF (UPF0154 family)